MSEAYTVPHVETETVMNTRRDTLTALNDADHAFESAQSSGNPDDMAHAQTAATLALAHAQSEIAAQMRTANRIALASAVADAEARSGQIGARLGLVGHAEALYDHPDTMHGRPSLRRDIADALGL
ncbi:MAG: hypothetical protein ACTH7N_04755 [Brevibacterium aurantiacum]